MSADEDAHTLTKKEPKTQESSAFSEKLLANIQALLDDYKAENVVIIDLNGKSDIADYMVIASGRSSRQVDSMAVALTQLVKANGVTGCSPEGRGQGDWVLLDAADIIVHLFRPEVREFYNLEKMWGADIPHSSKPAAV